jgi:hypothetical protein
LLAKRVEDMERGIEELRARQTEELLRQQKYQ